MAHLICYDIEEDGLRKKIADKLIENGLLRVQYSVFLGTMHEYQVQTLLEWLNHKVSTSQNPKNQILVLEVGKKQLQKMLVMGGKPNDKDALLGELDTVII
ncbi:MAG: CRISPR-associated endonuclease Cas2 [Chitinophagales bacterium]